VETFEPGQYAAVMDSPEALCLEDIGDGFELADMWGWLVRDN